MTARIPPRPADEPHEGAARLTGEQVVAINRFPDDNPNPVMRIDADGHLIYANPASAPVLAAIGVAVGDPLPDEVLGRFEAVVVGGMSEQSDDHTLRVAAMALDLAAAVDRIEAAARLGITFRIGVHCGPVVAGVIGTKKFIYDIWGETVNLASRMESHGVPGRVQVTHAVMERLGESFTVEPRGLIDVKGKGPTPTWLLVDRVGATSAGETAAHPTPRVRG